MESSRVDAGTRQVLEGIARFWWLWLVFGIGWVIVGAVILQFDDASITTVGVIVGIMFLVTGFQQFAIAALTDRMRWLFVIFGVLFEVAGVLALISPEDTFATLADILGFIFLMIGIFWTLQAMAAKALNELWWVGLIAGILMIILAFWTSGQFYIEKQYLLLVFAGIWALMQGFVDVVRAFQIKKLGELV